MSMFRAGSPEWRQWVSEILTSRSLVQRAKHSEMARTSLLLRYQTAIKNYLAELLLREKDARDAGAAATMAEAILNQVLSRMRVELSKGWKPKKGAGFRDDLFTWVHQVHWSYFKPRNRLPNPADPKGGMIECCG